MRGQTGSPGRFGPGAQLAPLPVETPAPAAAAEDPDEVIVLPSGQGVTLQDVVWNAPGPEGLTTRFRFIAPAIAAGGGTVDFDAIAADMLWLCQTYALPRIASPGPQPSQIVISLSDTALPFGEASPDATQFFEAYTIEDGQCVWSVF